MSWGIELWDQQDMLMIHTMNGIEILEKVNNLLKERSTIELEYAGKLRKLVKNFWPKKKDEEDYQYSSCKAFKEMLNGVTELAVRHETLAERFASTIAKGISSATRRIKDERKKIRQEASDLQMNLIAQMTDLNKAKKNYHKAHKEAGAALENYERADIHLGILRVEIEKRRQNFALKSQQLEVGKNEYIRQLQKFNELQKLHYYTLLPSVFIKLQYMDESRIKLIKDFMKQAVLTESNSLLVMKECLDVISTCSDSINEKEDSRLVIERYKTGNNPPEDIPFVDLGVVKHSCSPSNNVSLASVGQGHQISSSSFTRSTMNLGSLVNSTGSRMGSLPALSTVTSSDSLLTLSDPGLMIQPTAPLLPMPSMPCLIPDKPPSYEDSISEASNHTRNNNLSAIFSGASRPGLVGRSEHQVVGGQRLLDLSSSFGTPQNSSITNCNSGFRSSHTSFSDSDFDHSDDDKYNSVHEERLPVLGTCVAAYKYTANTAGSISLNEQDMVLVIEFDTGCGWTGVRRKRDSEEGFVPTSYLDWAMFKTSQNGQ